jgi:hypothetical protein
MTQTIRVEQVIRETVQGPYCDLVTRSTGRAVRTSIQQTLASHPGVLARLDFSEVGLVDFSCADEVIAKLLRDSPDGTTIVLQGLREEQLEAIEHVLQHHQLAALVHDPASGRARVVGGVSPDLRAAFLILQQHGAATAAALARHLGWAVARTEETLRTLARLRLVRVVEDLFVVPFAPEPLSP